MCTVYCVLCSLFVVICKCVLCSMCKCVVCNVLMCRSIKVLSVVVYVTKHDHGHVAVYCVACVTVIKMQVTESDLAEGPHDMLRARMICCGKCA